jgi:hypothetical protein
LIPSTFQITAFKNEHSFSYSGDSLAELEESIVFEVFSQSNVFFTIKSFSSSQKNSHKQLAHEIDLFTDSPVFSESSQFIDCQLFPLSNIFSQSIIFSFSRKFSHIKLADSTNYFTDSQQFSESNQFIYTPIFLKSDSFSFLITFQQAN